MIVLMAFDVAEIHGNTQTTMQKLVNFIILKLDKSTKSESEIGLKIVRNFGNREKKLRNIGIGTSPASPLPGFTLTVSESVEIPECCSKVSNCPKS